MNDEHRPDATEDAERIVRDELSRPATFRAGHGVHHVIDWDGGVGRCTLCKELWYCCRCNDF